MSATTNPGNNNEVEEKRNFCWPAVLFHIHIVLFGIFGFAILFEAKLLTIIYTAVLIYLSVLGVTAGAHRLWAHHSYEANTGLRIFLMLCHTLAGQGTIHDWVVRHRVHHKYLDTNDDPFNSKKGFWYSHLWTHMLLDSAKYKKLAALIDTEDLENDAVVTFQKKFYWLLMPIICVLLPVNAPYEYWGDSMINAIFIAGLLRYFFTTHLTLLITSAVHIWGLQPDEKYPADTMLVFILTKSHWLRYHNILPWDFQTSEYGSYGDGYITVAIRVFSALGWATDLRSVSTDTIKDAVYAATTSGKTVEECVLDITHISATRSSAQGHFHTTKFL